MPTISSTLAELFNPFNESLNHFTNSWDGATGRSSARWVIGAGLVTISAATGRDAAEPLTLFVELVTTDAEEDGVMFGRDVDAVTAEVFPLEPTVVHALPAAGGGGLTWQYVRIKKSAVL
jgi:hypothetical protein